MLQLGKEHRGLRHRYSSIVSARAAFDKGENITAAIRKEEGANENPPHAIEIAYALQTGSYVAGAEADQDRWVTHGEEIAEHLRPLLSDGDTILDGGTGEMTSLVSAMMQLSVDVSALAFDISWSRVACGRKFAQAHLTPEQVITPFVGDLASIALADNSVDVAMTVHALEPNGGREQELVGELLRLPRRHLVLYEPCFERSPPEAQVRMNTHGYVRNLERVVTAAGGQIVSMQPFAQPMNPLNPTWVCIIDSSGVGNAPDEDWPFRCPVTGTSLSMTGDVLYSDEAGLAYPTIGGIPLLRPDDAILAVKLRELLDP